MSDIAGATKRLLLGRPFRLPHVPRWLLAVAAVAVLAFTVARNVGGSGWVDWLASTTYV